MCSSDLLEINGGSTGNAYWGYSSGTGTATVTYDGNNTATVLAPTGGGARTTDGYSLLEINLPDNASQLRVRITMLNNSSSEAWAIDDITLTGVPTLVYAWSSNPAGFTSSVQNPTNVSISQSTIYTLNITAANGLSVSDTASVNVSQPNSATIKIGRAHV